MSNQALAMCNINEINLIISCLQNPIDEKETLNRISNNIDWDRFVEIVKYHSLASHVLNKLEQSKIPSHVRKRLRIYAIASLVNNLQLFDQLRHIVGIFERANIQFVLLKGFSLDNILYADKGLIRNFVDIDLLVMAKSIGLIKTLLAEDGYELQSSKKWDKYADKFRYHYCFHKTANNRSFILEVHTSLYPVYSPIRANTEELIRDSENLDLRGVKVRSLSIENSLIYLCGHFSYIHADEPKICYLYEIRELSQMEICWEKVIALAIKQNSAAFVYKSLSLADRLLGNNIPRNCLRDLKKGSSKMDCYLISKLMKKRIYLDIKHRGSDKRRWLIYYLLADSFKKKSLVLCDCISKTAK